MAQPSVSFNIKPTEPKDNTAKAEDVFGSYGHSTKARNINFYQGTFYFTPDSMRA